MAKFKAKKRTKKIDEHAAILLAVLVEADNATDGIDPVALMGAARQLTDAALSIERDVGALCKTHAGKSLHTLEADLEAIAARL